MRRVKLDDGWLISWTLTDQPGDLNMFTKLDGWFGTPTRVDRTPLWRDGSHSGPLWRPGRELTIAGFHKFGCTVPDRAAERDRLMRAISGAFRSGAVGQGTVQVTEANGITLEAVGVQLDGVPKFTTGSRDHFMWELPLYCDDPHLYEVAQLGAGRVEANPAGTGSGLEYPLFDDEETGATTGFLEWAGEASSGGGVLMNLGNATAYPTVTIVGDFPSGFVLTLSGDKDRTTDPLETRWGVTFLGSVYPGSPVTVDMGGRIFIDGLDRSWALSEPFWGGVEPGGQVTFTIDPISVGSGTATLDLRSTYI